MKSTTILGIVLVVLGVLALVYQGLNYTHQEKVIDMGPIHATTDTQEHVPLPPIAGGLALVAGVVLLVMGARQKTLKTAVYKGFGGNRSSSTRKRIMEDGNVS
jgi:drug/metabolite transporter (DMT)-like permease